MGKFWQFLEKAAILDMLMKALGAIISSDEVKKTAANHIQVLVGGKGHEEEAIALCSLASAEMPNDVKESLGQVFFSLMKEAVDGDGEMEDRLAGFMLMLAANTETKDGRYVHAENVWKAIVSGLGPDDKDQMQEKILLFGFNFRQKAHKDKIKAMGRRIVESPIWGLLKTSIPAKLSQGETALEGASGSFLGWTKRLNDKKGAN